MSKSKHVLDIFWYRTIDSITSSLELSSRMATGRGKCSKIVAFAILLLLCLYQADAGTHVVGDSQGWGFSVSYDSWTNGNTFTAGDTLGLSLSLSIHPFNINL
jgi:hypothetical protein